jgi:transposase
MSRAYSLDLRERVVKALASGQSCRAAAARFGVSVATVVRWGQRQRRTGSPAASRVGGYRPYVLAGERVWLLRRIGEKPDLTLRAIQAELRSRGTKVSYYAVWHFFEHEGITFKKKPARQRPGQTGRRKKAGAVAKASRAV